MNGKSGISAYLPFALSSLKGEWKMDTQIRLPYILEPFILCARPQIMKKTSSASRAIF